MIVLSLSNFSFYIVSRSCSALNKLCHFCTFRWKSGSRTAEPRRGNWSRRSWVSLTAVGVLCTVTRARWAPCRYRAPSAPRTCTDRCTLLREWTPCRLSGIYSKWLWLSEAVSPTGGSKHGRALLVLTELLMDSRRIWGPEAPSSGFRFQLD